jgi:CDP-diacylglycerol--glycerol-3-phosphate 3-phosphatidyltransferase
MAEIGKRTSVAVNLIAKIKTLMQMISVFLLLIYRPGLDTVLLVGYALLWVAALITLWSMIMYIRAAWSDLTLHVERE